MTGVGSERCPWLVVVRRGQRIRITLYDLATTPSSPWPGQRQSDQPQEGRCLLYATLREGLDSDVIGDYMICSEGDTREQVVYTSRDHTLAITIHYAPGKRFVLQYEGQCHCRLQLLSNCYFPWPWSVVFACWPMFTVETNLQGQLRNSCSFSLQNRV